MIIIPHSNFLVIKQNTLKLGQDFFSSVFLFEPTGSFRSEPLLWEVRLPRQQFLGRKQKHSLQKEAQLKKIKSGAEQKFRIPHTKEL
jgi:predicted Ser/Thr protein kinase